MSAIATTILAFVRPGDVILHSQPLYGGTETLFAKTLAGLSIGAIGFADGVNEAAVSLAAEEAMRKGRVAMIFIETPANPTNGLVDIAMVRRVADTIGQAQGHTPLVACASRPRVSAADGMLSRSLETLTIRMEKADANARLVADYLLDHAKVAKVHYLAHLDENSPAGHLFKRQCTGAGSTFSFDTVGGQAEAFKFLNALQMFKLAVSLGGTESLASLPASMTHSGVPADVRQQIGILDSTISAVDRHRASGRFDRGHRAGFGSAVAVAA
jgi:methionine-gamma-lyase